MKMHERPEMVKLYNALKRKTMSYKLRYILLSWSNEYRIAKSPQKRNAILLKIAEDYNE